MLQAIAATLLLYGHWDAERTGDHRFMSREADRGFAIPMIEQLEAATSTEQAKPEAPPAAIQPQAPPDPTAPIVPPAPATTQPAAEPAPPAVGKKITGKRIMAGIILLVVIAAGAYLIWKMFLAVPPVPASIVILSGRIEGDDSAVAAKTTGRAS